MHGHLTDRRIREGEAWAAIFFTMALGGRFIPGFGIFLTVGPTEHRM